MGDQSAPTTGHSESFKMLAKPLLAHNDAKRNPQIYSMQTIYNSRALGSQLRNLFPQGEWQYSATLQSWRELKYLGFDTGSGLENKDEVLDALEVN